MRRPAFIHQPTPLVLSFVHRHRAREEPLTVRQFAVVQELLAVDLAAVLPQRPYVLAWLRLSWLRWQSAVDEPLRVWHFPDDTQTRDITGHARQYRHALIETNALLVSPQHDSSLRRESCYCCVHGSQNRNERAGHGRHHLSNEC